MEANAKRIKSEDATHRCLVLDQDRNAGGLPLGELLQHPHQVDDCEGVAPRNVRLGYIPRVSGDLGVGVLFHALHQKPVFGCEKSDGAKNQGTKAKAYLASSSSFCCVQ